MDLTELTLIVCGAVIAVGGAANILKTDKSEYEVANQIPVYEDRNEDGIKDKIVKKLGENYSPPFMPEGRGIEEEVLYGAKLPNGKTIYLTKQQYSESQ